MRGKNMFNEFLSKIPEAITYEKLSEEKIKNASSEFYSLFNVKLPQDYIDMLRYTNGVSFNGNSIVGVYDADFLADHPRKKSMDIFRFNTSYRDLTDITDYILLGKSSIDLVVYNINDSKFQILSNGVMECFGTFDTFLELLYSFFDVKQ